MIAGEDGIPRINRFLIPSAKRGRMITSRELKIRKIKKGGKA